MTEPTRIPIAEFVRLGYLQEANRLFFHPLGMALEVVTDGDGLPVALGGVWDYRTDAEGVAYGPGVLDTDEAMGKAANVAAERQEKRESRLVRLGYDVQPIPDADPDPAPADPLPPGR